jgi:hypothetical protein
LSKMFRRAKHNATQGAYLHWSLLLILAAEEPADAVHGDIRKDGREFMELP